MESPRKKILYVITKSNFGGAQRYVYELATAMQERYDVVVLGGAFSGAASDPRRYPLTLKGEGPVRITARLKGKAGGEELAAQTLTVTPRKVQVKITNLGHAWGGETTKPLVWKPGVGPVRARQIMAEVGISESRRVRGLGVNQSAALIARFDQS